VKLFPSAVVAVALCLSPKALPAAGQRIPSREPTNPFFALCVGTHDAKYRTPGDQARLLKELGYAGTAHVWLDGVEEAVKAADDNGLKLFQIYIRASLAADGPKYDPRLKRTIESLKGRDTILGLLIQGKPRSTEENDPQAVQIVREIADMAEESGIRVALYPHVGDWIERVEDAVRVAKKVDRKNVGVTFNLCHWLAVDDRKNMRPLMELAMPHLFVVTVNGSNRNVSRSQRQGWIQPLDRGTYDVGKFIRALRKLGYSGPVGLQCYGIKGDVRENLKGSIDAWRKFSARTAGGAN
jgi:sugar phosphate isomerase/epimerase